MVLSVVKIDLMQNFIKLCAAVHELSCWQRKKNSWKPYFCRYRRQ